MALNAKEQLFAKEYIINKGNAFQAALKAGYKEKTARFAAKWLKEPNPQKPTEKSKFKPELKQYIDAELDRIHSEKTADEKEVMEYLTAVMRGESIAAVLSMCGDGCQEVIEKAPDEREKLKAAELLGKTMRMFTDKVNLEVEPVMIVNDLKE